MRQAGDAATKVQYAVEWHDAERLKSQITLIPACVNPGLQPAPPSLATLCHPVLGSGNS